MKNEIEASSPASTAEEIREAGHALIERMARHLEEVETLPVSTRRTPRQIARDFDLPLPWHGAPADEVWADAWVRVAGEAIQLHHPMYLGHQVAPPLPHAVLADAMTSFLNQSVAVWEMSPTGTMVERQVIRWMKELLGYPETSDGTLVSGGSAANLTGLLAAREARFPRSWTAGIAKTEAEHAIVLVSGQAHYSIERAVGLMGLGSEAVRPVPERDGKMDVAALERMIRDATGAERRPILAVVATASSTATGAFDDLDAIADVCEREGVWLHVDGAHGASFLCSPELRGRLAGIERADSVAWDPHKMMFMPISTGAIFVRDQRHLDAAFQQSAPYLFHVREGEERSSDIGKRTLQCSRRVDALKLWICLRHYGLGHFARLQEQTVRNTATLHRLLAEADDFEPMHAPEANILCFRHLPEQVRGWDAGRVDTFQARLRERYNASGKGWITATVLGGRRVLRVTLMNPNTRTEHLRGLLDGLREEARSMLAAM